MNIEDNVRIDGFYVLPAGSGGIEIGNHVHVAAYSSLRKSSKIILSEYCNLSSRVLI